MEWEEMRAGAAQLLAIAEELSRAAEPCIRANADSICAHARILCNEFGLDLEIAGKEE